MTFHAIGNAVARQFATMTATGLFKTQIPKDALWDAYLASFPPGSNPIFRQRTEHDCNSCKHFIRAIGGVVTIKDGQIVTIWDVKVDGYWQVVADAMATLVKAAAIDNIFLRPERTVGAAKNHQKLESGEVITWEHFFVNLPDSVVVAGALIGPKLADARSTKDVMLRGLQEITTDSLDTVLELIAQNSLYRGEEHKFVVENFRALKQGFMATTGAPLAEREAVRDLFCWARSEGLPQSVSRIRNTSIGTLLVDLSGGVGMEDAVKSFEAKVAPTNYKRPTALVTKAMIQKAQATIEKLGLTSALDRRYATIEDLTINNILFADRTAKKAMNVFDTLAAKVPEKAKSLDKVEEVGIEDFIAKVLPKADSLEVMFENRHAGNLVSLIAPSDPTARPMFKWPNRFSWSYAGEVADSIKERVKRAGGSVEGDLCCRLAWDYTDDLDFHMHEPGLYHISYINRRRLSSSGGMLDLDANGCDGIRTDPAENIFYADRRTMREGVYVLSVNNYQRRGEGKGFEVEIEFDGQAHRIAFDKFLRTRETVEVAKIQYSKAGGFKIVESLPSSQSSRTMWGVPTQNFHRVNVVMLSPNHWDEKAVGNKHYFFMLEGCMNEGRARGFFNEFLNAALDPHRKVLEMVGAKMKTEESDRQLSGLGFSSTQRSSVLCRVKGSFTRTVRVMF